MSSIHEGLALAFLAGEWDAKAMRERGWQAVAARPRWMLPLARRLRTRFETPPDRVALVECLKEDQALDTALHSPASRRLRIRRWYCVPATMRQVRGPLAACAVPPIADLAELASFLELGVSELDWFADVRLQNRRSGEQRLRHYRYRWIPKRSGGRRLLEAPKPRLKAVQRRILEGILRHIPPSEAAHGFVPGRSTQSFAAPHVGRRVVLRVDLEDFFPSVSRSRVRGLFAAVGYPPAVAQTLAALCTDATPRALLQECLARFSGATFDSSLRRLAAPHLPQGAPTSPALSNLVAYALDRRLLGLARHHGASYTRYADDLALSGGEGVAAQVRRLLPTVASIAMDESFCVRFHKTRVMFSGGRQHLVGLVVNEKLNLPRAEVDRLRAILHQARYTGLEAQNREGHPDFRAHLQGKIAYLAQLRPHRAERLRAMLEQLA